MRPLILLLLALMPLHSEAETLRRSYKEPAPKPITLSKEFFHYEEVPATCTRRVCTEREFPRRKEFCKDETSWENVCKDQRTCKNVNGKLECKTERKCGYEFVRKRKCEWKYVKEKITFCHDEKFRCTKQKKIHERDWEVSLNATFDPRATLTKKKDEKFSIKLSGDEREPKLEIKTERSPYKYATEYRFDPEAKSVNLEFRLNETE